MGRSLFLIGVFLTPWSLLRPTQAAGVSAGDILLLLGGLLSLARGWGQRSLVDTGLVATFGIPASLLIASLTVSTLANFNTSLAAFLALAAQFLFVLVFIPLVIANESLQFAEYCAKAFVLGLATSVLVGIILVTLAPSAAQSLEGFGFMVTQGNGRRGLFTGVGELAKYTAMSIPLLYYSVVQRSLRPWIAWCVSLLLLMAIVIPRSGLGTVAALVTLIALAVSHVVYSREPIGARSRRVVLLTLMIVMGFVGLLRLRDFSGYAEDFSTRLIQPFFSGGISAVGSGDMRIQLMSEASNQISQSPLWGVGPEALRGLSDVGTTVHFVPMALWAELGLFAMLGWLTLSFGLLAFLVRRRKRNRVGATTMASELVAFLAVTATVPYFYQRGLMVPLVISAGLLVKHGTVGSQPWIPKFAKRTDQRVGVL